MSRAFLQRGRKKEKKRGERRQAEWEKHRGS
jgi:hypothetical protein